MQKPDTGLRARLKGLALPTTTTTTSASQHKVTLTSLGRKVILICVYIYCLEYMIELINRERYSSSIKLY